MFTNLKKKPFLYDLPNVIIIIFYLMESIVLKINNTLEYFHSVYYTKSSLKLSFF